VSAAEVGVGRVARGLERAASFQQGDHGKDLVEVPLGDLAHEAAAPGFVAQQPFGGEHLERLAQRRARDFEPLAQRGLVQKLPGRRSPAKI